MNHETDKIPASIQAADALFKKVEALFWDRPGFFLIMDEMLLRSATDSSMEGDYYSRLEQLWQKTCPQITYERVKEDVDFYQRAARKWVWMLYQTPRKIYPVYLERLKALILMYQQVQSGILSGTNIAGAYQNEFLWHELRIYLGFDEVFRPALAGSLTRLEMLPKLEKALAHLEPRCLNRRTEPKPAERREEIPQPLPEQTEQLAQKQPSRRSQAPLETAQELLMWAGMVCHQQIRPRKLDEAYYLLVNTVWDDVMPQDTSAEEVHQWADRFYHQRMRRNKGIYHQVMLSHPYHKVYDGNIKRSTRLLFCVLYSISCLMEGEIAVQELRQHIEELYHSVFGKIDPEYPGMQRQIANTLFPLLSEEEQGRLDEAAEAFLQEKAEYIGECFLTLRRLDTDAVAAQKNLIEKKRIQAEEDIALMRNSVEGEAYTRLLKALSNPARGNVLGRLYLLSQNCFTMDSAEEMPRLMENFFLILGEEGIHPMHEEDSPFPGWSVKGKQVLSGGRATAWKTEHQEEL